EVSDVEVFLKSNVDEEVWYKLLDPHPFYEKVWKTFLWKARLAKYVLDYLHENPGSLFQDMKQNFYDWTTRLRGNDGNYRDWISAVNGNQDFRSIVANSIDFLWNQAYNIGEDYSNLFFFKDEFCPSLYSNVSNAAKVEKTVVTNLAYVWFNDLFPKHLNQIEVIVNNNMEKVNGLELEDEECRILDHEGRIPEFKDCISTEQQIYTKVIIDNVPIYVGDAVEVYPDIEGERWICYITEFQKINDSGTFRLIWLYTREQSILGNLNRDFGSMYEKEVFFTTHCECSFLPMGINKIMRKVKIYYNEPEYLDLNGDHLFFCRYYYRHTECAFLRFYQEMLKKKNGKLPCGCASLKVSSDFENFLKSYDVGDCILVNPLNGDPQDLYTVCSVESIDSKEETINLRRFYRVSEVSEKYELNKINEVLYSDYIFEFNDFQKVIRKCHVEFVDPNRPLPINLQHKGAGNQFFFWRKYHCSINIISPIVDCGKFRAKFPNYLEKTGHIARLRGLDLFCGGGSLGRGLEDAGVVHCQWAIDRDVAALRTYRHNVQGDHTNIINEDVNKVLQDLILGTGDTQSIPDKGEVDIILAGPPCQGFSSLNREKENERSIYNNSMMASVASFIDYYRPRYILIENVTEITKHQVFVRLLGFLLDLKYQIRFNVVSAAHVGCAQKRYRIFLWGASRDEVLPEMPPMTHEYKNHSKFREIKIFQMSGFEYEEAASFPMITIRDLIDDLPSIDTGIYWYPEYPDHHTLVLSREFREILRRIPPCSHYYHALDSEDIFSTIITGMSGDACCPKAVHYEEPRMLSVREAARAQGFLDSDLICARIRVNRSSTQIKPKKLTNNRLEYYRNFGNSLCDYGFQWLLNSNENIITLQFIEQCQFQHCLIMGF
ncbi:11120_t:CDS:2, partial [Acaulospora morrowiae]